MYMYILNTNYDTTSSVCIWTCVCELSMSILTLDWSINKSHDFVYPLKATLYIHMYMYINALYTTTCHHHRNNIQL